VLRQLQELFPQDQYGDLLVGLDQPDDAAVYALDDGRALILTCDFFTPIVDDPYLYGAIAAANAMSDIYAMGGEVILALNIAVFPDCLSDEAVRRIIRGGADKVREAGAVLAGGHTVEGPEPIFGMSVLGLTSRHRIWTKNGAQPGDVLLLTKPLGAGIITTAFKADQSRREHIDEAVRWMQTLNRQAADAARGVAVHAATDITGFSLLGHASEVAASSRVRVRLRYQSLPFMAGARDYANSWLFPAGTNHNECAFCDKVIFPSDITEEMRLLLFTPETSGGLLLSLSAAEAEKLRRSYAELGVANWTIGEVTEGDGLVELY